MSVIQDKLIKVTKIKPKKYPDRQEFLNKIALHISEKLTNQEYDDLADEMGVAIDWYETAVEAINHKAVIPDFPDLGPGDVILPEPVEIPEPTPEEIRIEKAVARYKYMTGERDKFGCFKGTKISEAMVMFEQGATVKQVKDVFGTLYYNKLHALSRLGHKVEQLKGNRWKLTHKDDIVKTTIPEEAIENVARELWDVYANYEAGDYPSWDDIIDESATINTRNKFRKMALWAIKSLHQKEAT